MWPFPSLLNGFQPRAPASCLYGGLKKKKKKGTIILCVRHFTPSFAEIIGSSYFVGVDMPVNHDSVAIDTPARVIELAGRLGLS